MQLERAQVCNVVPGVDLELGRLGLEAFGFADGERTWI